MIIKHNILFAYDTDIKKLFIYLISKAILFIKIMNTIFKKTHIMHK